MTLDEFVNEELKRVARFKKHYLEQRQKLIDNAEEAEADEMWPLEMEQVDWAEQLDMFFG